MAPTRAPRLFSLLSARCSVQHAYIIACCHVIPSDYLAVHKPPSLKQRLRGHITVDLRGAGTEFQTFVPSAFLTLHQTPFTNRSTHGFINGHLQLSFALPKTFEKPLKPFALPTVPSSFYILKSSKYFLCIPRRSSTLSISNSLQRSSDHQKVPLLLLLLIFAAF